MGSIQDSPAPLPSIQLSQIDTGISLLKPLSRLGHGPGLIVLSANGGVGLEDGVPSSLMKWGEEGYTVVEICASAFQSVDRNDHFAVALRALLDCESCTPKGKVGLICECLLLVNELCLFVLRL